MVQTIYREKQQTDEWKRWIVTAETGNLDSVRFDIPLSDKRVKLEPVPTKLYLLDYLKISFPMNQKLTIQSVIDSIPKNIVKDVYAVEYIVAFTDPWELSLFFEDVKQNNYVVFVALLTEKDTGKDLPPTKLTNDRPIGISDDDWARVVQEFRLDEQ